MKIVTVEYQVRWLCILLALAFFAGWARPGLAEVSIAPPVVTTPKSVTVDGEHLVADFVVTTKGTEVRQLILPAQLVPETGSGEVTAVWTRTDGGSPVQVEAPVALSPGTTLGFRLEAKLPDTRRYVLQIALRPAGSASGAPQVLGSYMFQRALTQLPSNFLPSSQSHAVVLWPWLPATAIGARDKLRLTVKGANTASSAVSVESADTGPLVRQTADNAIYGTSLAPEAVNLADDCDAPVAPQAFCTIEVLLPAVLAPGRYTMALAARGTDGGVSTSQLTLNVKAPGWFAAMIVGLGALVGAAIAHWREVDRPRALVELPLVTIADQFRMLAGTAGTAEVARVARDRVAAIQAALLHGRIGIATPMPDPVVLAGYLRTLRGADRALVEARNAGLQASAFEPAMTELLAALQAEPWDHTATEAALQKFLTLVKAMLAQAKPEAVVALETATTSQIVLPIGQLLPGVDQDSKTFVRRIARMDMGTATFMAALIGLGGLAVLWVNNPTWGAGLDLITAFAAGVATRLTLPTPTARPN